MRPTWSAPRWRPSHREVSGGARRLPHRGRAEDGGAGVVPRRGGRGRRGSLPPPPGVASRAWSRALAPMGASGAGVVRHGYGRAVPAHTHEDVEAGRALVSPCGAHGARPDRGVPSRRSPGRRAQGGRLARHLAGGGPVVVRGGRTGVSCTPPGRSTASAGRRRRLRAGRWSPPRTRARRSAVCGGAREAGAVRGTGSHGGSRRQGAPLTTACT